MGKIPGMNDVLYVTPGVDGLDYEYTWDKRSWAAFERLEECRNYLWRLYRTLIFISLTRGVKGRANVKNKTATK